MNVYHVPGFLSVLSISKVIENTLNMMFTWVKFACLLSRKMIVSFDMHEIVFFQCVSGSQTVNENYYIEVLVISNEKFYKKYPTRIVKKKS